MANFHLSSEEEDFIRTLRNRRLSLSPREEQYLTLLIRGFCTHKELANEMLITTSTSKVYTSRLFLKLQSFGYGVNSLAELTSWAAAREHGTLDAWKKRA